MLSLWGIVMIEWARKRRNRNELKKIHPAYRSRFELLIHRMESRGFRPRLQGTWRSNEEQERKYAEGLSQIRADGPHTNVFEDYDGDIGVTMRPAALATHVLNDDAPLAEAPLFWAALAIEAWFLGLQAGLHWGLTGETRSAILAFIEGGNALHLAKYIGEHGRGWDPNHVEAQDWREAYGQGAGYDPFKRRT